jgi:hypothetical protein
VAGRDGAAHPRRLRPAVPVAHAHRRGDGRPTGRARSGAGGVDGCRCCPAAAVPDDRTAGGGGRSPPGPASSRSTS